MISYYSVVVSRKSNKIGFIVKVTPMIADDDVRVRTVFLVLMFAVVSIQ